MAKTHGRRGDEPPADKLDRSSPLPISSPQCKGDSPDQGGACNGASLSVPGKDASFREHTVCGQSPTSGYTERNAYGVVTQFHLPLIQLLDLYELLRSIAADEQSPCDSCEPRKPGGGGDADTSQ